MAFLADVLDCVLGVQTEIVIFLVALCLHTVLFGSYRVKPNKKKAKQVYMDDIPAPKAAPALIKTVPIQPAVTFAGAEALARTVKQLLRSGATREAFAEEIGAQVHAGGYEGAAVCPLLASALDSVGKNASAELVAAVRDVLREHEAAPSTYLGELLLRNLLSLRLQAEFEEVLNEIEAAGGATASIAVLAMRSALTAADFEAALAHVRRFAPLLKASIGATTPSSSPQQLMQQLIQLAIQKESLPALLDGLADCELLTPSAFEAAMKECVPRGVSSRRGSGDAKLLKELVDFARTRGLEITEAAGAALVRGATGAEDALSSFEEAAGRGKPGRELLCAALEAGVTHRSSALAEAVLRFWPSNPTTDLGAALLRSIADGPLRGKEADNAILKAYEEHLPGVDVLQDTRAGKLVAEAALRRKRPEVLGKLLAAVGEQSRVVGLLKGLATEGRLADATAVFDACPAKSACLYNALLDACVDCQSMEAAERIMGEAVENNMADVITYNTLVKKHLQRGHFEKARSVLESMRAAGGSLAPNAVTFNELIDATIKTSVDGAWVLIDEMKACGLVPTTVTASILLKSVQQNARPTDMERTMAVVADLEDDMDEVLLSSVCEACIRTGRADLLQNVLQRQRSSRGIQVSGAHTFGSVIRAYGFLKDMEGAWDAWTEMRSRKIVPTSITTGCMVEALVSNGDPEAGLKLIHELASDEKTRSLLNAIVYCSVVKGFTHQKQFDRVWVVYQEMIEAKLQFSIVTYNALIDACARAGEMVRVQPLLQDMTRDKIEPNLVTYSTIVKGYCQEGRLDKALELLGAMKKSRHFRPDEITYNTLIDGCAQRGLYDQGSKLLEEMQEAGVSPSNFTLSVAVKLANRARRPERAFELVEELSRKYCLQPNVHVYNNLVHACTNHNDLRKAIQVLERMTRHRVRPDQRTYTLLLRGCVEAREFQEAAGLLRLACGAARGAQLPQRLASLSADAHQLQLRGGGLSTDLLSEVLEAIAGRGGDERLAVQLCKDLRSVPGVRLDPKLSMNLTSRAIRS